MTTTSEVKEAFSEVEDTDVHYIPTLEQAAVTVPESSTGLFFKALRESSLEAQSKRVGDALVAHIDIDKKSLADLF